MKVNGKVVGVINEGQPNQLIYSRAHISGPNGVTIFETPDGDFLYRDGSLVKDKKHLALLAPHYRKRAYEWFEINDKAEKAAYDKDRAIKKAEILKEEPYIEEIVKEPIQEEVTLTETE